MAEMDPRATAMPTDTSKGLAAQQPQVNRTTDTKATAGEASTKAPPQTNGHAERSGFERAEEIVEHLAEKTASVTAASGRKVLWFMSRARQVAEDFWADVQDFRHGKKP